MGGRRFHDNEVGTAFRVWLPQEAYNPTETEYLTFRHRASSIQDRRFTTLQRTLFISLINKYISLSDICLTYITDINNIDNQLDATITAY